MMAIHVKRFRIFSLTISRFYGWFRRVVFLFGGKVLNLNLKWRH